MALHAPLVNVGNQRENDLCALMPERSSFGQIKQIRSPYMLCCNILPVVVKGISDKQCTGDKGAGKDDSFYKATAVTTQFASISLEILRKLNLLDRVRLWRPRATPSAPLM